MTHRCLLLPLLYVGVPMALAGCGDDDGGMDDAGTDSGTLDDGGVDAGPTDCVVARTIEGATTASPPPDGLTGNGDLEVTNGLIRTAFSAVDRVPVISGSGGVLTDLHYLGQSDHLNEVSQLGGTSQALTVVYTEMEVVEDGDDQVVVEARGHVDPRPDEDGSLPISPDPGEGLEMVTTYTIGCMDPRVRIESVLTNNSGNDYGLFGGLSPLDIIMWGRKSLEPFCPNEGQGTECLPFSFSDPLATIVRSNYVGSTGSLTGDPGSLALYSDTNTRFNGIHSSQVSTVGDFDTSISVFMDGDTADWSRVLVVGDDADAASSLDVVLTDLAELGRIETATVSGTVEIPEGSLSANAYERPLVLLATPPESGDATDPDIWTPANMVRVSEDGTFSAVVPAGTISWELRVPGRPAKRGEGGDAAAGGDLDLGTLTADPIPVLDVEVTDGSAGVPARVTVVGSGDTQTPSFGSPWGPSPAANMALTDGDGMVSVPVPEGTYDVYASHGIGWTLAHDSVTVGASGASVTLQIEPLDVFGDGFLTADFHVHSAASFDSSLPPTDRVMAYIAEGVDAIVSTEHDVVFDYGPALATVEETLPASWQGRLRTFVGVESTQFVPWEQFPHTIGHYNAFPVQPMEGAWKNGAPLDEYLTPPELYESLRAMPSPVSAPLVQLNHGRSSTNGSIWLGYFDSCGFDPTAAFDPDGMCWSTMTATGTRPWDYDAMEIINAKSVPDFVNNARDWYAILLNAPDGRLPVGTANSDSHALAIEGEAGYPVTVLQTDTPLAELDDASLVETVSSGPVAGALGVFVWFSVRNADSSIVKEPGQAPVVLSGDVVVDVRVAAAPWVPVEEVRVRVGGEVVARRSAADGDWTEPTDAFGTAGVVRYVDSIDLTLPGSDTFITVEAGVAIPRVGDLDGDGRAEAADTDGDGDVDGDDGTIEDALSAVPVPFGLITLGGRPLGFANPVFVDVDDDGWEPPGVPLVD